MESEMRRAFERLIRKLLNFPNKPAVVLVNSFIYLPGNRWVRQGWLAGGGSGPQQPAAATQQQQWMPLPAPRPRPAGSG
jgi:hypothetical protein